MKRYKNKIIIALALMSAYIFITIWQARTYEEVHAMYPLSKSKNPQASAEFLKAMEYRIYIKELHPFFDYDSFVMAPLLEKLDYHLQKGKALLPKDSVEDIVWWTLFYKEIYGLLVPPRNDNSLAYENLPYQEFAKVHDEVYEMIMRYPEGEVYFNLKEIEQFRFKAMAILVGFYVDRSTRRYQGKTQKEKSIKAANDVVLYKNLQKILKKYKLVYKKINLSKNQQFMEYEYLSDIVYIYTKLIMNYTFIYKTQKLPTDICYSNNSQLIIAYTNKLIKFVENVKSIQSQRIYTSLFREKYTSFVPTVFKLLDYRCENLEPETSKIVQRIEQLNKKDK